MEPKSVDAGRGVNWWTDGWTLFMKNPGMWVVLGLVLLVICVVLGFVPLLGSLATALLMPAFIASWMLACRKQEGGGTLEVGDLFLAFKDQLNPLLVLGALSLAATFAVLVVMWALGVGAMVGMGMGAAHHSLGGVMAAAGGAVITLLVGLALFVPISMAFWFAPALVVFDGVAPVDAIKASFAACLKNVVPFLVYGVVGLVASIVASIPIGLGWLVLGPVLLHTIYLGYRDIFAR
ncbi:MAG: BPSS1780 family membrane protein [Burkholderiaceae bacterium]